LEATALGATAGRAVRGFHDDFQVLVREADPNDAVIVPIRAAPPLKPPTPRRVTLIGDAIHTMPPFGAHGANTAFKDAHTLAAELSNGTRSFSVAEAIGWYESRMHLYSRPVMKSALRMMTMATADFPLTQSIFRTVRRAAGPFTR